MTAPLPEPELDSLGAGEPPLFDLGLPAGAPLPKTKDHPEEEVPEQAGRLGAGKLGSNRPFRRKEKLPSRALVTPLGRPWPGFQIRQKPLLADY